MFFRLLFLGLVTAFSVGIASASCLWAVVPGCIQTLGTIGNPPGWTTATTYGQTYLDTSSTAGAGIFFGNPGSSVRVKRAGQSWTIGSVYASWPSVNFFSGWSAPGQQPGYGWSIPALNYAPNPSIDFASLFPTPLVAANAVCTRIWLCDPRGFSHAGWFVACVGSQDAVWSARSEPVVNVYGDYGNTPVDWAVTGWPVAYMGGYNYNFVSLISITALFPCEMMEDFFLPAANFAIMPSSNDTITLSWDGNWGCRPPSQRMFAR